MITKCAACGKRTVILYPDLWAYKRGNASERKWMCSWSCLRLFDKIEKGDFEKMENAKRDRAEVGRKVLELLGAGQSPLPYLEGLGYANPAQAYTDIKRAMVARDPALEDKFPKSIKGMKKTIETPEGEFVIVATKELPKVTPAPADFVKGPMTVDEFVDMTDKDAEFEEDCSVAAIRISDMGEFYFDQKFNSLDWRYEGEEISMHPLAWKRLAEILPKVFKKLGVDA